MARFVMRWQDSCAAKAVSAPPAKRAAEFHVKCGGVGSGGVAAVRGSGESGAAATGGGLASGGGVSSATVGPVASAAARNIGAARRPRRSEGRLSFMWQPKRLRLTRSECQRSFAVAGLALLIEIWRISISSARLVGRGVNCSGDRNPTRNVDLWSEATGNCM